MKRILILSIMTLIAFGSAMAQIQQPEKITVNTSDLTVDQLAKIKAQQEVEELQSKLETYGKWVGVGGEIGAAVKESLNSVVDVADKFGNTNVGKFTLTMVAWKVIGKDLVRIVLGIFFIIITEIILFKSLRKMCLPHKVCVENAGWQFWKPKKYEIVEPSFEAEGLGFMWFLHICAILGTVGITYAIMFA